MVRERGWREREREEEGGGGGGERERGKRERERERERGKCLLTITLSGVSDNADCENISESLTGLWLDMVTFAVVVIQIVLSDTQYGDQVEQEKMQREAKAAK